MRRWEPTSWSHWHSDDVDRGAAVGLVAVLPLMFKKKAAVRQTITEVPADLREHEERYRYFREHRGVSQRLAVRRPTVAEARLCAPFRSPRLPPLPAIAARRRDPPPLLDDNNANEFNVDGWLGEGASLTTRQRRLQKRLSALRRCFLEAPMPAPVSRSDSLHGSGKTNNRLSEPHIDGLPKPLPRVAVARMSGEPTKSRPPLALPRGKAAAAAAERHVVDRCGLADDGRQPSAAELLLTMRETAGATSSNLCNDTGDRGASSNLDDDAVDSGGGDVGDDVRAGVCRGGNYYCSGEDCRGTPNDLKCELGSREDDVQKCAMTSEFGRPRPLSAAGECDGS